MQDDHGDAEGRDEHSAVDARNGTRSAPSPATPRVMNDVPPRNVPEAAPGNPAMLAARPAAMFSISSPEMRRVKKNVETPRRRAAPRSPAKNASAPRMISPRPMARRASETSPDGMPQMIPLVDEMRWGSSVQSANAPRSATRRASRGSLTVQTTTRRPALFRLTADSSVYAPVKSDTAGDSSSVATANRS